MKKVLHIISTDGYSGAENVACQIINMYKDEYDMLYTSKIGSNKKKLESLNIKYISMEKLSYFNLKKIVNREKPDILHAHDARSCIVASLFEKKCKIIGHIHGNHENMRTKTLKSFLVKHFSKKMNKIIWVTSSAFNDYYYREDVNDKSIVIENVIDKNKILNEILNDSKNYPSYDLVYLGRLSYPKNPLRLISVLNMVRNTKKDVKMAIIGTGDLEDDVKKYINEFSLNENVDMYGFVSNPYKILSKAKIMIMTSRFEGVPMCALEAMSLGIPIVSTPTDGLKCIIEHGENGYLGEADDELAQYISQLLKDEKKFENLKKSTLEKSNIINDIQAYKNRLRDIYEN